MHIKEASIKGCMGAALRPTSSMPASANGAKKRVHLNVTITGHGDCCLPQSLARLLRVLGIHMACQAETPLNGSGSHRVPQAWGYCLCQCTNPIDMQNVFDSCMLVEL